MNYIFGLYCVSQHANVNSFSCEYIITLRCKVKSLCYQILLSLLLFNLLSTHITGQLYELLDLYAKWILFL